MKIDKTQVVPCGTVQVSHKAGTFVLKRRWFSLASIPTVFFMLFWNFGVVAGSYLAFREEVKFATALFFTIFWLAGAFLLFKTLQEIFNSTTFQILSDKVVIRDHPISFSSAKTYSVSAIVNFGLNKNFENNENGARVYNYGVYVHLTNGETEKVCSAKNMNEAIYIEHLLEKQLGIADDPQLDRVEA